MRIPFYSIHPKRFLGNCQLSRTPFSDIRTKAKAYLCIAFGLLAFLFSCADAPTSTASTKQDKPTIAPKLAAQLWTFRYELQKDVPGTLKKIKNLGIDYVEGFDAPYITGNPEAFKAALDSAGLQLFALHWSEMGDWRKNPAMIMQTAKKLGAEYVGIAWLKTTKEDTVTLAVVNEAADLLTQSCAAANAANLQLYYHIHGYELQPMAGDKTFFDSFMQRIDSNCVRLEADIFWVVYAGQDPTRFMEKYRSGIDFLHIKDMAPGVPTGVFTGANFMPPDMPAENWVPLGRGKIDYKSIFLKGKEIGVRWYILEMDKYGGDVFAAVDSSLAYIKKEQLFP